MPRAVQSEALDEVDAVFRRAAPLPPLFLSVPGRALDEVYGLSAASRAAAVANKLRSGWWLASMTRTRRVLRRIVAPILSKRTRMVAAPARSSSVACNANAHVQRQVAVIGGSIGGKVSRLIETTTSGHRASAS